MDSSAISTEAHGTLSDVYDSLRTLNEELQKVHVALLRASGIWSLNQKDASEIRDRPEHWVDPKDRDIWSNENDLDAWAREAKSKGLFDSKPVLRKELKTLGDRKMALEHTQRELRLSANKLSRPSLRRTHILDLPDEVLARVFDFAEGCRPADLPYLWSIVSQDMKNCRLTCQDFCRVSSRHFLRSVAVDLSSPSISRFEEISHHPIISKGVRVVRAVLHFYDPALSENFLEFVLYQADELEERLEVAEWMGSWRDANLSEETGLNMMKKAKEMLESWRRISSETPEESLTEEDRAHLGLLRTAHQKYQTLCANQQELYTSGEFSRIVASAIARMPCARILYLVDRDLSMQNRARLFGYDDVSVPTYQNMLRPMDYYTAYRNGFETRLCDTIIQLPMAVKNAGAWLERIDIEFSYLSRPLNLLPSSEVREELPLAMRRLKQFSFKCKHWMDEESIEELDEETLDGILTPFCNTPSLREISIDMSSEKESGRPSTFSITKLLRLKQWGNLSELFLRDVSFHLSDFRRFVNKPRESLLYMGLEGVRLLSGTWAEVLDILRGKSIRIMTLRDPLGAECEEMSTDELAWAFGRRDILARTEAELYIAKMTNQNPLRK